MEFDLENPFTSFQEYQSDTILDLFASESDHLPSREFLQCLKTRDFLASFREQAISLILQAQCSYNYDPFVSYLAINYMDRFISRKEITEGKSWVLRLLVISCLSLASKMKNAHFSISNFQRDEENFVFDTRTINRMELLILDVLNWRMRSITPFSFLPFFVSILGLNKDPSLARALKDRAKKIIFKAQNEIKLLEFKPSTVAASALLVACREQFPSQFPSFRCSIFSIEHVNNDKLEICTNALQEMIEMVGCQSALDPLSPDGSRPLSVIDGYHCSTNATQESDTNNTTSMITTVSDIKLREKREIKRRKLNGYCQGDLYSWSKS